MTNREWFELNYTPEEQSTYVIQRCPPETGGYPFCRYICDNVACNECWQIWFNEKHYEPENEARH